MTEKDRWFLRLNSLRGIFALEIVIGHVVRSEDTSLFLFGKFMIISVAFFFFVSGMGLTMSCEKKDNYLKGFLIRKIGYLFAIATVTLGINMIIDFFCKSDLGYYPIDKNIVLWFAGNTNWYLFELALFYILFFTAFKYIKKYAVLFIWLSAAVLITLFFLAGWTEMWYASAMGFPTGVMFGRYCDKVIHFLKTAWGKFFTLILILLGLSSQLLSTENLIGMVYLRNIMCIAGMLLLIYFVTKYNTENKMSKVLSMYSTEIFLFQFVWLKLTESYELIWQMRLPVVIAGTTITAIIVHPVFVKLKKI